MSIKKITGTFTTKKENKHLSNKAPDRLLDICNNEITSFDVIKSLSNNFNALYYTNLEKGEVAFLNLSDRIEANMGEIYSEKKKIDEYAAIYAEKLVHPDYKEEFVKEVSEENLRKVMADKAVYTYDYVGFLNGQKNFFRMRCARVNNSPVHLILGFEDVDEQIKNSQKIAHELKAANEVKNTFLRNISHELLTPLNSIIGFTEMISMSLDTPSTIPDSVDQIKASSRQMLYLIHNILSMTEMEGGLTKISEEPCNILDLMDELGTITQFETDKKNINFVSNTYEIITPDVLTDVPHLNRVLSNLLGNAVKFTNPGGTIIFSLTQYIYDDDVVMCEFHVKDNGIGMTREYCNHLFDMFSREYDSSEGTNNPGAGLGMAITKQILDMMNGTITVNSKKDFGTEFVVKIPLKMATAE